MTPNEKAFLNMLKISELGQGNIDISDNGYNVLAGSTPSVPRLFNDYSRHPNKPIYFAKYGVMSSAAGAYQIIIKTWNNLQKQLNLPDFSPDSQDAAALELIRQRGGLEFVRAGQFADAVNACRKEWASLPGAGAGQRENKLDDLKTAYLAAGGTIA